MCNLRSLSFPNTVPPRLLLLHTNSPISTAHRHYVARYSFSYYIVPRIPATHICAIFNVIKYQFSRQQILFFCAHISYTVLFVVVYIIIRCRYMGTYWIWKPYEICKECERKQSMADEKIVSVDVASYRTAYTFNIECGHITTEKFTANFLLFFLKISAYLRTEMDFSPWPNGYARHYSFFSLFFSCARSGLPEHMHHTQTHKNPYRAWRPCEINKHKKQAAVTPVARHSCQSALSCCLKGLCMEKIFSILD